MLLIVGLGNPGAGYAANRHNIGFMAVEAIKGAYPIFEFRTKFQGEVASGTIGDEKVLLLKPNTFMNDSGRSVQAAMTFYKIPPEKLIVLHDELDLIGGKVRVKRGGGHAGHNGLRSIHAHVGEAYVRVRLGIGHPGHKEKVITHVLTNFSKTEKSWLDTILSAVAKNFTRIVIGDDCGFMSEVAAAMASIQINHKD
ncbi:MAG: aminoacyl-tRNA hydrolase [Rhodospirillaceae bacterium TMED8]|nr:aminoacyl-tRNA hydrolase [Magnetovibrio sp.]OUT47713.1 MAG: aminoacyl-tRNA hydrolase [Rhodospirillaceae bacterium TMED8]|tara:strand:+ start:2285 stop:2875 length:591 start_codon:yes stop_codon:yes gene_type:complete